MVRKITILSNLCYHANLCYSDVYSSGINNVSKDFVEVVELLGYKIKFMACSTKYDNEVDMTVEPVMILASDPLANIDYEYNVIRYFGDNCGIQTMIGKGAGPVTSNAIVNDIYLLMHNYDVSYEIDNNLKNTGNKNSCRRYLIESVSDIPEKFIEKKFKKYIITKKMNSKDFNAIKSEIIFYAKIIE